MGTSEHRVVGRVRRPRRRLLSTADKLVPPSALCVLCRTSVFTSVMCLPLNRLSEQDYSILFTASINLAVACSSICLYLCLSHASSLRREVYAPLLFANGQQQESRSSICNLQWTLFNPRTLKSSLIWLLRPPVWVRAALAACGAQSFCA